MTITSGVPVSESGGVPVARDQRVQVGVDWSTAAEIDRIAAVTGLSRSAVGRILIRAGLAAYHHQQTIDSFIDSLEERVTHQ